MAYHRFKDLVPLITFRRALPFSHRGTGAFITASGMFLYDSSSALVSPGRNTYGKAQSRLGIATTNLIVDIGTDVWKISSHSYTRSLLGSGTGDFMSYITEPNPRRRGRIIAREHPQ